MSHRQTHHLGGGHVRSALKHRFLHVRKPACSACVRLQSTGMPPFRHHVPSLPLLLRSHSLARSVPAVPASTGSASKTLRVPPCSQRFLHLPARVVPTLPRDPRAEMSGLQPDSSVAGCSADAAHPLGCACSCFARPQGLHVAEVTSRRLSDDLCDGTEVVMVGNVAQTSPRNVEGACGRGPV